MPFTTDAMVATRMTHAHFRRIDRSAKAILNGIAGQATIELGVRFRSEAGVSRRV